MTSPMLPVGCLMLCLSGDTPSHFSASRCAAIIEECTKAVAEASGQHHQEEIREAIISRDRKLREILIHFEAKPLAEWSASELWAACCAYELLQDWVRSTSVAEFLVNQRLSSDSPAFETAAVTLVRGFLNLQQIDQAEKAIEHIESKWKGTGAIGRMHEMCAVVYEAQSEWNAAIVHRLAALESEASIRRVDFNWRRRVYKNISSLHRAFSYSRLSRHHYRAHVEHALQRLIKSHGTDVSTLDYGKIESVCAVKHICWELELLAGARSAQEVALKQWIDHIVKAGCRATNEAERLTVGREIVHVLKALDVRSIGVKGLDSESRRSIDDLVAMYCFLASPDLSTVVELRRRLNSFDAIE